MEKLKGVFVGEVTRVVVALTDCHGRNRVLTCFSNGRCSKRNYLKSKEELIMEVGLTEVVLSGMEPYEITEVIPFVDNVGIGQFLALERQMALIGGLTYQEVTIK